MTKKSVIWLSRNSVNYVIRRVYVRSYVLVVPTYGLGTYSE